MDDVTDKLLTDGIAAFEKSLDGLLAGVDDKREAIITDRPPTVSSSIPSELEPPIAETVKRAVGEGVARRVWSKDETLWGGPGPEIGNRLGWLTISEVMLESLPDLLTFVQQCKDDGLKEVVLLGMGGSSLGPEVLGQSFGDIDGGLRLHVLDSTDPAAILAVERAIKLEKTLFLVSSKSGGTLETLSQFQHFHSRVREAVGEQKAGSHFVAITDPGSPLIGIADQHAFRRTFENDPDIGGRYSVLSYFGLVPAALMGIAVDALLHRAQIAEQNCTRVRRLVLELGPVARAVDGQPRPEGPRQADVRRSPSRSRASACGSSSSSRRARASRAEESCRWPTSRWATRTSTATTACSPTCATPTSPTPTPTRRSRRWARQASRR